MTFFQKYQKTIVGLSLSFTHPAGKALGPLKFFIRCNLVSVNPVEKRENTGIIELEYKSIPDELIIMLGHFLDSQELIKTLYEEYGNNPIKVTPEAASIMGYNLFATISEQNTEPQRILVYMISSKNIEHLEAEGGIIRTEGSSVNYQLFFRKYRVATTGIVKSCSVLPNGLIKTASNLPFCPELVEIIDDYWYSLRSRPGIKAVQ
jgi:hypothetical protein